MLNELIDVNVVDFITKQDLEKVDFGIKKLSPLYRTIVKKIIFEKDNIWWCDYYSKSTFYRLRNRALKSLALFLVAQE